MQELLPIVTQREAPAMSQLNQAQQARFLEFITEVAQSSTELFKEIRDVVARNIAYKLEFYEKAWLNKHAALLN